MANYSQTSSFGPRVKRDGSMEFHVGEDYKAPVGTPVPARSSGEVIYSGPSQGFRHAVTIKSVGPEGEYYTTYGHVDSATALLPDAKVAIGQAIGTIGAPQPGDGELTTGPHVHIQMVTKKRLDEFNRDREPEDRLPIREGTRGGVGLKTGRDRDAFQDPSTFTGWADGEPYDILAYGRLPRPRPDLGDRPDNDKPAAPLTAPSPDSPLNFNDRFSPADSFDDRFPPIPSTPRIGDPGKNSRSPFDPNVTPGAAFGPFSARGGFVTGSNASLDRTGSFVWTDRGTDADGRTISPDDLAPPLRSMPPTAQEPAGLFSRFSANPLLALPTAGSGGLLGMLMQRHESRPFSDVDSNPQQAALQQLTGYTSQPSIRRLVSTSNGVPISSPSPTTVPSQDEQTSPRRFPGPIFDSSKRSGMSDGDWLASMLAGSAGAAAPQDSEPPPIPDLMGYLRYLSQAGGI